MSIKEEHLIAPLLFVALFSMTFLFCVAYTQASFNGSENAFPDTFSFQRIAPPVATFVNTIADNFVWSVETAHSAAAEELAQVHIPVAEFFGLENYHYGATRYTALQSRPSYLDAPSHGEVLGIYVIAPQSAAGN